jgi:hypothetical protein
MITCSGKEVRLVKSDEYIALPEQVAIRWIGAADDVRLVHTALAEVAKSASPLIGLDAEWSAYTGFSRYVNLYV